MVLFGCLQELLLDFCRDSPRKSFIFFSRVSFKDFFLRFRLGCFPEIFSGFPPSIPWQISPGILSRILPSGNRKSWIDSSEVPSRISAGILAKISSGISFGSFKEFLSDFFSEIRPIRRYSFRDFCWKQGMFYTGHGNLATKRSRIQRIFPGFFQVFFPGFFSGFLPRFFPRSRDSLLILPELI